MFNVFNINNQHENYESDGKRNEKRKQTRAHTHTHNDVHWELSVANVAGEADEADEAETTTRWKRNMTKK